MKALALTLALALTATTLFAQTTITWNGGGADNNWSTIGNWGGAGIPNGTNNQLDFSTTASQLNPNNDIAGLTVRSIDFSGASPSVYTLSGNGIILGDPAGPSTTITNPAFAITTFNFNITLGRDQLWYPGVGLSGPSNTFNGNINTNGFNLTAQNNGFVTVNGAITGSGTLNFNGAFLQLTANNTYTGLTSINGGILQLSGTIAGNLVLNSGGAPAAILAGSNGTINGTVIASAGTSIDPSGGFGSTPNPLLNFGSDVTFNSATYDWLLDTNTDQTNGTAGTDWSLLKLNGGANLTFSGSSSLNLVGFNGSAGNPTSGDPFWNSHHQWEIGDLNTGTLDYSGLSISNAGWGTGNFGLLNIGNDLYLYWNTVPEPSIGALVLAGLVALGVAAGLRAKKPVPVPVKSRPSSGKK